MQTQVRIYRVREGELGRFVEEWRAHVVPLRRRFGFQVVGAWACEEDDRFVWVLAYEGEDGLAAANARYYESEERAALDPDPARLLEVTEQLAARPVV